ncbi:MAG: nitric-oxide reductase large subunit [Burkholderiaceae bacterium]|jgi:nitric oxide reductase subunit B|nr:nitric-oxide reductase large subunit [Burkholderiaceae bacterium]
MASYRKFWTILVVVLVATFSLLGFMGREVYQQAPPIPAQVKSADGKTLFTDKDIYAGQSAWQSVGGMELGTIWGHGAYQAPDWTADWLHRELTAWLDLAAQEAHQKPFTQLSVEQQGTLRAQLKAEYRGNHIGADGALTVSARRAQAMVQAKDYYMRLFGNDPELQPSRVTYAMKINTLPNEERRAQLTNFFYWTAWAAGTSRPGSEATYTNNWPHEPLIDNAPTAENVVWSLVSVIFLLAGVGLLVFGWSFLRKRDYAQPDAPTRDPLTTFALTPSQRALGKYLFIVVVLFLVQVFIGGLTAHYTVNEPNFYGIDLTGLIPYSLARTWHLQSALFWIATGFLAAGLFLAPIINGGKDPKFQKLGVDVLFWALIVVVAGSFLGQFLAISQKDWMPPALNFWLGHQGYEYLDLGRLWQIALFIGIVLWLVLMVRGVLPALLTPGSDRHLLALLTASIAAVGLFYGTGLFYGEHTNLSIMEYWRWWVVHLWVEGFFEVFTTAALAFIFCSLGLVSRPMATAASLGSAVLFMLGGVPGTLHHLYFAGTTTPIMATGASFSALEVVPLILLGHEAWEHWHLRTRAPWMEALKWPLLCFVFVAFWNMLGAGVFGFLINPPISLYYVQGLNTSLVHAHAALFGVYGFLALGFTLMILRYIRPQMQFSDALMKTAFWCLNLGLVLMITSTMLPIGLMQFHAAASVGLWYARSAEFLQQNSVVTLHWLRTVGDVIFIIGALALIWQVIRGVLFEDAPPVAAAKPAMV